VKESQLTRTQEYKNIGIGSYSDVEENIEQMKHKKNIQISQIEKGLNLA